MIFVILLVILTLGRNEVEASVYEVEASVYEVEASEAGNCQEFSGSCQECVEGSVLCGWCESSVGNGTCIAGGPVGPAGNESCVQWSYDACGEPSECVGHDSCSSCAGEGACGWCAGMGGGAEPPLGSACLAGNASGPTSRLSCADWVRGGECADDCFNRRSCVECLTSERCGWCGETGVCMAGDGGGASFGTCPGKWNATQCEPGDRCRRLATCGECLEDEACGWCYDEAEQGCRARDERDQCLQWRNETCEDPCRKYGGSCDECVAHSLCGWCDANSVCLSGDALKPYNRSACETGEWLYGSCAAECASKLTCDDCLFDAESDCAWCSGVSGCMNSTAASQYCKPQHTYRLLCPVPFNCSEATSCEACTSFACWYCAGVCSEVPDPLASCYAPSETCWTHVTPSPVHVGASSSADMAPPTIAIIIVLAFLALTLSISIAVLVIHWTVLHYGHRIQAVTSSNNEQVRLLE